MTTPHTSGDSVAAPTISDELLNGIREFSVDPNCYVGFPNRAHHHVYTLLQYILRLRSASAAPVEGVDEWRPISTAPKDTEVLIGCWSDNEWKWGRSVCFYECGNEMEGENYKGWFWSIDDCMDSVAENPTHWQPLPSPPKAPAATAPPPVEAPAGESGPKNRDALYPARNPLKEYEAYGKPSAAPASATRVWPFVESPGEFADRLSTALIAFDGFMLSAVRNVLIENPPQLAALRTDTAPTCGVTEDAPNADARDAARFRWCQDNPHAAQAMFWNHSSRRDRAKAIDAAMSSKGERG